MHCMDPSVTEFIQDNDVKFIKFAFCDVFGRQKIISVLPSMLPKAFEEGVAVDASRIEGFYKPGDSEIFLFPDSATLSVLPWRPSHGRVARFYCHIKDKDGKEFAQDGRKILRDAVQYARERHIFVNFGTENDFYLFKTDEMGEPTDIPFDRAGFMDEAPEDRGEDVRRDICLTLEDMGIQPLSSHHISGPGQNRIDFEPGPALNCADHVITFRSVVKMMAVRNGLWASFAPKPIPEEAGNGFRIAMRPQKGGQNCCDLFMAGVLKHIREIGVFLNPLDESYERLGTFGAPRDISWADEGRASLLRRKSSGRIEISSPDGAANPYLAFALLLYAGVDGVERGLPLGQLPSGREAEPLPRSLQEARKFCLDSSFLQNILPQEILQAYTGGVQNG